MDADGNNHHVRGGPGGEGGSFVRRFLTSPAALPESLAPATLLTISLVLSVALVGLATIALAP